MLALAQWHRLAPMLHAYVSTHGVAPTHVLEALEEAYLANAARNLFVAATLTKVLQTLNGAGTPAMLLKGAVLIGGIYPDPALRELTDLDLLVHRGDLDAANEALGSIGFRPADDDRYDPAAMRADHHHDVPLVDHSQIAAVELHYHIVNALADNREPFDIAGIWQRARPGDGSAPHLVPADEDLLLHLCLHFSRNRAGRSKGSLAQVADIAWTVDSRSIDWEAFVETARAARLGTPVFLALFAAAELGCTVPHEALEDLHPPGFDPRLGRRLVDLRVLRGESDMPARTLRFLVAPGRDALQRGWGAEADRPWSFARAYVRRGVKKLPLAKAALRRPWTMVQDYRLNRQLRSFDADARQ